MSNHPSPGRPPSRNPARNRITLRLTDRELLDWTKAARNADMSKWVRRVVGGSLLLERPEGEGQAQSPTQPLTTTKL